jgi:glycosyltransferase involved in cell wall biosynthesis
MKKVILISRCAWTLYNFRAGLIRKLLDQGCTVIGAGSEGDGFEFKLQKLGITFVPLPVSVKPICPVTDLNLLAALYQLYRSERPDVVHHFTIKPVIYGSLVARLCRVPIILNTITGLGAAFIEPRLKWLRWLIEWQYRLALRCSSFTFFQNAEDLAFFRNQSLVPSQRAGLLPGSGVDCESFSPSHGGHPTSPTMRFLFVGRLLREKGLYEFMEAARRIKADYPDAEFQLLGRRDERNPSVVPQADLTRWQHEGVVTWLGEVEDVRPIMAAAHVVVLPSYREGTPRALLEAAAMAKPLIATDAVGCREVVEHGVNGLLVPIGDAHALADAMRQFLCHPEWIHQMGSEGRQKMQRQFDERIVISKVLQLYATEGV